MLGRIKESSSHRPELNSSGVTGKKIMNKRKGGQSAEDPGRKKRPTSKRAHKSNRSGTIQESMRSSSFHAKRIGSWETGGEERELKKLGKETT